MKKLVELFCDVDDFCKAFIPQWQKQLLEDGTWIIPPFRTKD
jgi:hypothetical protein